MSTFQLIKCCSILFVFLFCLSGGYQVQTVSDDLLKKSSSVRGPDDDVGDLHNTLDSHNTKEAPFGDNSKDEEESSRYRVHLIKSQRSGLI